jgi:hypothetical protein
MTYFTHHNAPSATVHDIQSGERFKRVQSVDTDTGVVEIYHDPLQLDAYGEIYKYAVKFKSIWPIYAGHLYPVMFQCSERIRL